MLWKEKEIDDFLILELGKNLVLAESNCPARVGISSLLAAAAIIRAH